MSKLSNYSGTLNLNLSGLHCCYICYLLYQLLRENFLFLVMDEELFIFQLAVKNTETTFKIVWKHQAIKCRSSGGLKFGFIDTDDKYADVLDINSNPNKYWCACSALQNYKTKEGLTVTNETLAGSDRFRLTRMEVFEVIEE